MNIEDTRNTISRIWVSIQSITYNIHNRKKKTNPPVLIPPYVGARDVKETVWTKVTGDFDADTEITPKCITLFTEIKLFDGEEG